MSTIRGICSIENCNDPHKAKGYCNYHYVRLAKPKYIRTSPIPPRTPEYSSYCAMKNRVNNPNSQDYFNYGGRGIRICTRWNQSFKEFFADMGKKPNATYTIDRKNPDGHYSCGQCEDCISNRWPMNCRWATPSQQVWNRRKKPNTISRYRGVTRNGTRWQANIGYTIDEKRIRFYLGNHKTQEEAAIAYDIACIFFRGEYAITNIL